MWGEKESVEGSGKEEGLARSRERRLLSTITQRTALYSQKERFDSSRHSICLRAALAKSQGWCEASGSLPHSWMGQGKAERPSWGLQDPSCLSTHAAPPLLWRPFLPCSSLARRSCRGDKHYINVNRQGWPVPRINRPSAPAVNPTPFTNTDTCLPRRGKRSLSLLPLYLRFTLNLSSRMLSSLFCLFYFFFGIIDFFFSRGTLWFVILISWIHIQEMGCFSSDCSSKTTTIITIICIELSHASSHKNSWDLESEETDSCLDSTSYLLRDLGHVTWPLWVLVAWFVQGA